MSAQANTAPALPSATSPQFASATIELHADGQWPIESQKTKDEKIRKYAKKIAMTQYANTGGVPRNGRPSEHGHDKGKEHMAWPSPEVLMEIYTKLLQDSHDPKFKEPMPDHPFVVSSLAEKSNQRSGGSRPIMPCGCGIDHDDYLFPDDSYEDEPDEEDFDSEGDEDDEDEDDEDEDDDDDDDEDDYDDEDDEDDEDEDDDDDDYEDYDEELEQDMFDGYRHRFAVDSVASIALEEEKRMFASISQIRNDKSLLEDGLRKKQLYEAQKKKKQEDERIRLLQRLRLEDEERRKREQQEKERKERLEQELRKKREATEADQAARSYLFMSVAKSNVEVVVAMIEASPMQSSSLANVPRFATTSATRLTGWEYIEEGGGKEASSKQGYQETLLHIAARVGCLDLVSYFIRKGAPLDALDSEGLMPLHTAAKHNAPVEVCKLLIEKAAYHIDRHSATSGKTALHYAAQNGYGDLVAMLLQHHARVNVIDSEGNTPEMLAKAGLDREKSSKARSQKYRSAIQHIQKSLAAIKEAQRQKDALLEEQRRKEEELAKEEAEKDRAARRKQEEKLEADQRRRDEEEKELARLKALASDSHGQNSGGASKKKKKKKGKGSEVPLAPKETLSDKSLFTPTQNIIAKSTSPSPLSSPAINQSLPSPQKISVKPATQIPTSTKVSTVPSSAPSNVQSIAKTSLPTSAPSPIPESSSGSSASESLQHVKTMSIRPSPSRLPKAKTNYRPSQLVVTRMVDMGFPQRDSKKALIQTEGKVEEAIELLTSGAPLADDSEDELERVAQETARRKAMVKEAVILTPKTKKQDLVAKVSNSVVQPQPTPVASTSKPSVQLQAPSSQQSSNSTLVAKKPVSLPIQILNRPPVVPPHFKMRAAPTQVLQRSSMQARNSPSPSNKAPPSQSSSVASHTPILTTTAPNTTPFLAQRTAPPLPPSRAPYSYGSSSTQDHNQSLSMPSSNPIPSNTLQDIVSQVPGSVSTLNNESISPTRYHSHDSSVSYEQSINSAAGASYLRSTDVSTNWDSRFIMQNNAPFSAAQVNSPVTMSNALLVDQNSSWRMMAPQHDGSTFEDSLKPFQPLPLTDASVVQRRSSFTLLTASMSEMLHQSQMDMVGDTDSDMIRDVLAMTGAIDPDELESTLSSLPLTDSNEPTPRVNTRPSIAVGEGRSQPLPVARNPVASLWEYGSFTQEISGVSQSWSTSLPQRDHSFASRLDENNVRDYNQWNSSSSFEADKKYQMQHQGSLVASNQFINNVFGSPSPVHSSLIPGATSLPRSIISRPNTINDSGSSNHGVGSNLNINHVGEPVYQVFDFADPQSKNVGYDATKNTYTENHPTLTLGIASPVLNSGPRFRIDPIGIMESSRESDTMINNNSSVEHSPQQNLNAFSAESQIFNNVPAYSNLRSAFDSTLLSTSEPQRDRWKTP